EAGLQIDPKEHAMTPTDQPNLGEQTARAEFADAVCVVGLHMQLQNALDDLARNPLDQTSASRLEMLLRDRAPRARTAMERLLGQAHSPEGDR
ncbi:MAG: hypothetical protein WA988_01625, partial [Candidatus Nanopelagicales bacterium]